MATNQKEVYDEVKKGGDGVSWRQSKKARLSVLVGLILVAVATRVGRVSR